MSENSMSLLGSLLTPKDCAECRFCCSYKRRSLWETPFFTPEEIEKFKLKNPDAKFKKISGAWTFDIDDQYQTDDIEEEALCPFNKGKGCIINAEDKSFECSSWPFRVMRKDGKLAITICKDCPMVAKRTLNEIQALLDNGLDKKLEDYAKKFPAYVRDYRENYQVMKFLEENQ